ncbi:unnamed protein product [Peronospora destructor]|uniref:Uncharacterized protein n=1 Tax=Peronospora destructor TaxID=86335 RepID=A0AAV0VF95_9STRA|nr:unnamed protein product [Peronospora destructor]
MPLPWRCILCSFRGIARNRSGTQTADATPQEMIEADGDRKEKDHQDLSLNPRMEEFEARCHLQLEDTDVENDVTCTPAATSIVPKKSKLTEWLEKFEAQHRVEKTNTRVPEYQKPHVSPLTAWMTRFEVKHQDNSSTASFTT